LGNICLPFSRLTRVLGSSRRLGRKQDEKHDTFYLTWIVRQVLPDWNIIGWLW